MRLLREVNEVNCVKASCNLGSQVVKVGYCQMRVGHILKCCTNVL